MKHHLGSGRNGLIHKIMPKPRRASSVVGFTGTVNTSSSKDTLHVTGKNNMPTRFFKNHGSPAAAGMLEHNIVEAHCHIGELTSRPKHSVHWFLCHMNCSSWFEVNAKTWSPVKNVLLDDTLRKLWQIQLKQKHMTALTQLWVCILDNNFVIQVKLMAASRIIFRPLLGVFNTLNYLLWSILVQSKTSVGFPQWRCSWPPRRTKLSPL